MKTYSDQFKGSMETTSVWGVGLKVHMHEDFPAIINNIKLALVGEWRLRGIGGSLGWM
jgi:hypothetical protein